MNPQPASPDLTATVADLSARLALAESRADLAVTLACRADTQARRFRVAGGVLVAVITLAVVAPLVSPAVAQGYGVTLATLNTRLTTAESRIVAAEGNIKNLQTSDAEQQDDIEELRTREERDVSSLIIRVNALQTDSAALQAGVAALQTKTASMSVLTDPNTNQPTVRFTNVNLQVVNGGGKGGAANSRGNLIVGYNDLRSSNNVRTGSHTLVVGAFNNYSSESGGVVFGARNSISGLLSSVLGGGGNTASGELSSVSGGSMNEASGLNSSASGGLQNASISSYSAISGGQNITQNATFGWSAGGAGGAGTYHTP